MSASGASGAILMSGRVADVVAAIGGDEFGPHLVGLLHALANADHCAAFRIGENQLDGIAASSFEPAATPYAERRRYLGDGYWRFDPILEEAHKCMDSAALGIVRIELSDRRYASLRSYVFPKVRDRVMLCGRREEFTFGLSIIKSDPHSRFSNDEIARVHEMGDLLVSLLAKHSDVCKQRPSVCDALARVADIESCLSGMVSMPRREIEVCARVLHGVSSASIGVELGIAEETVKTYRKRTYHRFQLASARELLTWYLSLWNAWHGQGRSVPRRLLAG
jgi:DNA-binding CsgD family transcriptional regulator